jgi:hypothetical protein
MHPVRCLSRRAIPLALALALAGCQSAEQLTLDASNRPAKEPVESYSLVVKDPAIETDTLRHQEAERLVKAALAGNGYYESPDPARADMAITIDYGIGPARTETAVVSHPIYRSVPRSHTESVLTGTTPDGRDIYTSVTIQDPPDVVYAGEDTGMVRETVYDKRLVLQARKVRPAVPNGAPDDLWTVEVLSTGPTHSLRQTLPVLAAVALEHMGEDTEGPKAIKLTDAEAVAFVKKLASEP